ncbi:hypothetical protein OAT18_02435 [Tenacibaculum sp.]|nr:hypothetical protein [Tenacibaculum sp.]
MKFLKLFFFGAILFFTSCNNNSEEVVEIAKEIKIEKKGRGGNLSPEDPPARSERVQLMYMTSFLIGKTLLEDETGRSYFYQYISNPLTVAIRLNTVLDDNYSDSTPFEAAFHERFNDYNSHINIDGGNEVPAVVIPDPDPIRWGGVLDMHYFTYLNNIINNRNLGLYFPNKRLLQNNYANLSEYFQSNDKIVCLWENSQDSHLYDGVILNIDGSGDYLPQGFKPENSPYFIIILK